jgi:hypothetical protein
MTTLSLKERIKIKQGTSLQFLNDTIQDCVLSYLSGNEVLRALGKTNLRYYSIIVPKVMKQNTALTLNIPKVERINKEKKTIEDLLTWNREVQAILKSCCDNVIELDLSCADFKIFNPLNEKLITSQSFF